MLYKPNAMQTKTIEDTNWSNMNWGETGPYMIAVLRAVTGVLVLLIIKNILILFQFCGAES